MFYLYNNELYHFKDLIHNLLLHGIYKVHRKLIILSKFHSNKKIICRNCNVDQVYRNDESLRNLVMYIERID